MNLPTLILIALKENDGLTGYDIAKLIKGKWNAFWSANHQQIYRDLNKLMESKFVIQEIEEQPKRPDRLKYSLTNKGKQHLDKVKKENLKLDITRDKLAVLLLASNNDEGLMRAQIYAFLVQCKAKHSELAEQSENKVHSKVHQLIIEKQVFEVESDIKWSTKALKKLKELEAV